MPTKTPVLARFKLVYKLRVDAQGLTVVSGRPPARFVAGVRDVIALHHIERGEIDCKGHGRHARLRFSSDFPEHGRQAIRNVWTPPTTPGSGGGRRARG